MKIYSNRFAILSALLALAGGLGPTLRAQSAAAPASPPPAPAAATPAAPGSGQGSPIKLEAVTVNDVPIDEQVLPTVRPISSVLGDETSILDIPRSVSSVNKAWMDERQVKDAMDFGQFSPGVYSSAQYGIPATPNIRGDLGQIFYNGQIGLFTRNSIFPSFNGVEAMDIIKGPGSVVYGPQGNGPGGYVNFVTKQPYWDRMHADIDFTMGYLTSGHSYSNPSSTIDVGGPLSDKLAFRLSYLSAYGDGYYVNDKNATQDLYGAIEFKPSKPVDIQWWAQGYTSRFNEVTGVNRVTQQFIDHGVYIGGQVYAPNDFDGTYSYGPVYNPALPGTAYNPANPASYPAPSLAAISNIFYNPFPSNQDGGLSILDPATAYAVKLPAYDALLGPQDSARGKRFQSQMITTVDLAGESKLVNQAYFEDAESRKFETYGYDEYVPLMESIQDRLEYHNTLSLGSITDSLIGGADFRYSRLLSYQDYTTEPFGVYDLYQNTKYIFYPGYYVEGQTFGGGLGVPGAPGYSGAVGNSGNQDSHIYDPGIFLQNTFNLTKNVSVIAGVREDRISANTESPPFVFEYYNFANGLPNGTVPATGATLKPGSYYQARGEVTDPSYFGSLVIKPSDTQTFYLTYNRTQAVQGSANYGGVGVSSSSQAGLLTALSTASTLSEAGYKQSFLANTLFIDAAVYQQLKLEPQIQGPAYHVKTDGFEADLVYQPSKALTFNANFTYQSVTDFGSGYFEQTYNYLDLYPASMIIDGQHGTAGGSPNLGAAQGYAYEPPGDRMKAPGVPQVLSNLFAEYTFPAHFGFGVGPQIQGRQYANDQGTLHIPTEWEWDGYLFYKAKTWDVRVNVSNILNQRLLDPIDVTFAGNDTIYVRPPIAASLTVRYHY